MINRTYQVSVRFTDDEGAVVEAEAERSGQRAGAWLRERGLEAAHADDWKKAMLAEVKALQQITISLLFAFARDGKLPEAKVREIVAKAKSGNGKPVEL